MQSLHKSQEIIEEKKKKLDGKRWNKIKSK